MELTYLIKKRLQEVNEIFAAELEGIGQERYWRKLRSILAERTSDSGSPDLKASKIASLFGCLFKRARISYLCESKLDFAPKLVHYLVEKMNKKVLVFFERIWCAESLSDDLDQQLAKRMSHRIEKSGDDGDYIWCKVYHSGMSQSQRADTLELFADAGASALCVCRALDEGLDVPSVDAVVLVASTQSERQRLQRIGRALRWGDGNKKPLVFILYAAGTSDDEVRILPGDEDFKDVATVHEVRAEHCLEYVANLSEPNPQVGEPLPSVTPNIEWSLFVGGDRNDSLTPEQAAKNFKHLIGRWVKVEFCTGAIALGRLRAFVTSNAYFEGGGDILNENIATIYEGTETREA